MSDMSAGSPTDINSMGLISVKKASNAQRGAVDADPNAFSSLMAQSTKKSASLNLSQAHRATESVSHAHNLSQAADQPCVDDDNIPSNTSDALDQDNTLCETATSQDHAFHVDAADSADTVDSAALAHMVFLRLQDDLQTSSSDSIDEGSVQWLDEGSVQLFDENAGHGSGVFDIPNDRILSGENTQAEIFSMENNASDPQAIASSSTLASEENILWDQNDTVSNALPLITKRGNNLPASELNAKSHTDPARLMEQLNPLLDAAFAQTSLRSRDTVLSRSDAFSSEPTLSDDLSSMAASTMNTHSAFTQTNKLDDPRQAVQINTPISDPAFKDELAERIVWLGAGQLKSATISIHPRELGPVNISISYDNDKGARIVFHSEHAAVREAIEMSMPRLRESFQEQQMNLLDVSVSSDGAGQGSNARDAQGDRSPLAGNTVSLGNVLDQNDETILGTTALRGPLGLVDYYA